MKPFHEIHATDLEAHSLKEEMDSRGYVLIRGLLPADDLDRLLGEITQIICEAGWLLPGPNRLERIANTNAACGDPDPSYKAAYEQVFSLESFHALAHHPALQGAMKQLVGLRLLIHPKPIGRLIFPHCERLVIHAHQDHHSVGGDPESFTAWMPLHDCPTELGPLQVLEASHRFGLQNTDAVTGIIPMEAARGGEWVSGQINAGDVLIFHSLTVHAASPNLSNQIRISMDCRFQDYERALNPSTLVFPGSSNGNSWERIYADWRSDDLKYFWKRLPLRLRPSRAELARLAENAESPQMRTRYARIFSQIESEMPG